MTKTKKVTVTSGHSKPLQETTQPQRKKVITELDGTTRIIYPPSDSLMTGTASSPFSGSSRTFRRLTWDLESRIRARFSITTGGLRAYRFRLSGKKYSDWYVCACPKGTYFNGKTWKGSHRTLGKLNKIIEQSRKKLT